MTKVLLSFLLFLAYLQAKEIYPTFKLKSMGFVNDFVINENFIYVANDAGTVDIFNLTTQKLVDQIVLEPLETKLNKIISPNIISVDYLNGKVLIVSIGIYNFRNVWIYENHFLKNIVNDSKKLNIKEARFLNDEQIFYGTFASEIILQDTSEQYNLYKRHLTQSTMGDMVLSRDKTKVVYSDESGEVHLVDTKTSETLEVFSSENVDNVYYVAYANDTIITGGQDRRVGVYQKGQKPYHIKTDFLVYCVGITPNGKLGVYTDTEEADLQLFDVKTKEKKDRLIGHSGIVGQIKFINNKELFSSERSPYVYYWRLD